MFYYILYFHILEKSNSMKNVIFLEHNEVMRVYQFSSTFSFSWWQVCLVLYFDQGELKICHVEWQGKHWKDWKFDKGEIKYGSWQLFIVMKLTSKRLMFWGTILSYVNYTCDYNFMRMYLLLWVILMKTCSTPHSF